MKEFLRGFISINLFPKERKLKVVCPHFFIITDAEAFQKDIETVGRDMWLVLDDKYLLEKLNHKDNQLNDRQRCSK